MTHQSFSANVSSAIKHPFNFMISQDFQSVKHHRLDNDSVLLKVTPENDASVKSALSYVVSNHFKNLRVPSQQHYERILEKIDSLDLQPGKMLLVKKEENDSISLSFAKERKIRIGKFLGNTVSTLTGSNAQQADRSSVGGLLGNRFIVEKPTIALTKSTGAGADAGHYAINVEYHSPQYEVVNAIYAAADVVTADVVYAADVVTADVVTADVIYAADIAYAADVTYEPKGVSEQYIGDWVDAFGLQPFASKNLSPSDHYNMFDNHQMPDFTFHGTDKSPEVIFQGLKKTKNSQEEELYQNNSLIDHFVDSVTYKTNFVSTSRSYDVAKGFNRVTGWIYVVRPINGQELENSGRFITASGGEKQWYGNTELEIAVPDGIGSENIYGAYQPFTGKIALNPNYSRNLGSSG